MGRIGLKVLLSAVTLLQPAFYRSSDAGGEAVEGGLGGWGGLVMVCCVSSGSSDSPNVGVIYTPTNKQASLRPTVNAKA